MTAGDPVPVGWLLATAAELPAEDPDGDRWLAPAERAHLATLRFPRRRADWRLGRWAAKRALAARLGLPWSAPAAARLEIQPRTGGAPEAFLDGATARAAIGISHRAGAALAAVAPAGTALGCDLELIEPRSEAFVSDYLTAAERVWVAGGPEADRPLRANLLWSAKESALKVLGVGLRRDPREVEISIAVADPASEAGSWLAFTARLDDRLPPPDLSGWWRRDGAYLLTLACHPAPTQPRELSGRPGRERGRGDRPRAY